FACGLKAAMDFSRSARALSVRALLPVQNQALDDSFDNASGVAGTAAGATAAGGVRSTGSVGAVAGGGAAGLTCAVGNDPPDVAASPAGGGVASGSGVGIGRLGVRSTGMSPNGSTCGVKGGGGPVSVAANRVESSGSVSARCASSFG